MRQNPEVPFYRMEEYEGRLSLRYATADLMRPECVSCHNTHPDTPKKGWKTGDVRGVLEVIRPVESVSTQHREGMSGTVGLLAAMTTLGLLGLGLVVSRFRQTSQEANGPLKRQNRSTGSWKRESPSAKRRSRS